MNFCQPRKIFLNLAITILICLLFVWKFLAGFKTFVIFWTSTKFNDTAFVFLRIVPIKKSLKIFTDSKTGSASAFSVQPSKSLKTLWRLLGQSTKLVKTRRLYKVRSPWLTMINSNWTFVSVVPDFSLSYGTVSHLTMLSYMPIDSGENYLQ